MSIRPVDMQVAIQRSDQYTKDINRDGQIANNQFGIAVETQKRHCNPNVKLALLKPLNITILAEMMTIRQM